MVTPTRHHIINCLSYVHNYILMTSRPAFFAMANEGYYRERVPSIRMSQMEGAAYSLKWRRTRGAGRTRHVRFVQKQVGAVSEDY
jgi:hypothetical protein